MATTIKMVDGVKYSALLYRIAGRGPAYRVALHAGGCVLFEAAFTGLTVIADEALEIGGTVIIEDREYTVKVDANDELYAEIAS